MQTTYCFVLLMIIKKRHGNNKSSYQASTLTLLHSIINDYRYCVYGVVFTTRLRSYGTQHIANKQTKLTLARIHTHKRTNT